MAEPEKVHDFCLDHGKTAAVVERAQPCKRSLEALVTFDRIDPGSRPREAVAGPSGDAGVDAAHDPDERGILSSR